MRLVLDTNTVVSALLWHGPPRRVLDAARKGRVDLFTSSILLAELLDVLSRPEFAVRLEAAGATLRDIVLGYASLTATVNIVEVSPVVLDDPDDDHVLACAIAAGADAIVTGDTHLLRLRQYKQIRILTASESISELDMLPDSRD